MLENWIPIYGCTVCGVIEFYSYARAYRDVLHIRSETVISENSIFRFGFFGKNICDQHVLVWYFVKFLPHRWLCVQYTKRYGDYIECWKYQSGKHDENVKVVQLAWNKPGPMFTFHICWHCTVELLPLSMRWFEFVQSPNFAPIINSSLANAFSSRDYF